MSSDSYYLSLDGRGSTLVTPLARLEAQTAVGRFLEEDRTGIEADDCLRPFLTSKALIRVFSVEMLRRFRKKITVAAAILTIFRVVLTRDGCCILLVNTYLKHRWRMAGRRTETVAPEPEKIATPIGTGNAERPDPRGGAGYPYDRK
ncbi:hypothetical protein [Rhizobium lusitanum]|uniref:Uncharacterized protein n=1 Tax=Rhizobium lusitanum TaxID=293958 RepID=A0A7X0MEC3_9HYPH|nr:hypothetical protein [Rhizobium lusitanum]MBB6487326.1 hypothetical protein [Rhizobium lusitanum]